MVAIHRAAFLFSIAVLFLTACSSAPSAATSTPPTQTPEPTSVAAVENTPASSPEGESAAPVPAATIERADWQLLPLVNARTGETFTLADFEGKTVFVEAMATWCVNCRQQMRIIRDEVLSRLDSEDYVFIGLSVETNLAPETLAAYVNNQGFNWTFAVMSPDVLIALSDEFGRSITNPPSTPHFVIRPDGSTGGLIAGRIHSADELVEELTAANGA